MSDTTKALLAQALRERDRLRRDAVGVTKLLEVLRDEAFALAQYSEDARARAGREGLKFSVITERARSMGEALAVAATTLDPEGQ